VVFGGALAVAAFDGARGKVATSKLTVFGVHVAGLGWGIYVVAAGAAIGCVALATDAVIVRERDQQGHVLAFMDLRGAMVVLAVMVGGGAAVAGVLVERAKLTHPARLSSASGAASPAQTTATSTTQQQTATPPISLDTSSCANSGYVSVVYVGTNTSCSAGASAYGAYSLGLVMRMESTGRRNPVALRLTPNPNNTLSYAIACIPTGSYVSCTGGNGALVRFPSPNPCQFDHSASSYCATRANPYCQMGQCSYPAPASKVCPPGWSYQPPQTTSEVYQYGTCQQSLSSTATVSTAPATPAQSSQTGVAEGPGSYSHTGDAQFCSTGGHVCIPSFSAGSGYVVQCRDGEWSHSGGTSGACSDHGGEE